MHNYSNHRLIAIIRDDISPGTFWLISRNLRGLETLNLQDRSSKTVVSNGGLTSKMIMSATLKNMGWPGYEARVTYSNHRPIAIIRE